MTDFTTQDSSESSCFFGDFLFLSLQAHFVEIESCFQILYIGQPKQMMNCLFPFAREVVMPAFHETLRGRLLPFLRLIALPLQLCLMI